MNEDFNQGQSTNDAGMTSALGAQLNDKIDLPCVELMFLGVGVEKNGDLRALQIVFRRWIWLKDESMKVRDD